MAGSITWRRYTDDLGRNWSIAVNKNNADQTIVSAAGFSPTPLCPERTGNYPELPCEIMPRHVVCHKYTNGDKSATGKRIAAANYRYVVSDRSSLPALLQISSVSILRTNPVAGKDQFYLISKYVGETIKIPPRTDDPRTR